MYATANHYTLTLEGSEEGWREAGEEDGGYENDTCIEVSSIWKNRIECIPSIYSFQSLIVGEIPNKMMSARSARV